MAESTQNKAQRMKFQIHFHVRLLDNNISFLFFIFDHFHLQTQVIHRFDGKEVSV